MLVVFAGGLVGGVPVSNPAIGDTFTLASYGFAATGAGTYLFKGTLTTTGTGTRQTLIHVDSGATSNRYMFCNAGGSGLIQLFRTTGGAGSSANGGTITAGVQFRAGMAVDGLGGAILSFQGLPAVSVTGGPVAGLTTIRLGQSVAAAEPMAGTIAAVRLFPGDVMTEARLRASVAAF